ncbi:helix-turn-helix transcriptional regulator [Leucobacter viscericola]|uniref:Helix-turn-helix transcriptional regulator n=1 Tax=Leucobacter viscericola TaxID=2714935 RepID=A0A6G7XGD4_9MICO|nr:helix-turn-helix transcriptional regulator [Leucobacter viscericola]
MNDYETQDLTRHVAGTIRGLMAQYGVNQAEMAEAIGVSQSQLSKMTRGTRPISLDHFHAMCWALGASATDVLSLSEQFVSEHNSPAPSLRIYVEDGRRLPETRVITSSNESPLLPVLGGRKRTDPDGNVTPSEETRGSNDLAGVTSLHQRDYARVAEETEEDGEDRE